MYNITLNTNTLPNLWKRVTIISILKPNKNHNNGTTRIIFISHFQNIRENIIIIPTENIPVISYKNKHFTCTTLHNICYQVEIGLKNSRPLQRTVEIALDMSKAFDLMNIHKLIHKHLQIFQTQ